MGNWHHRYDFSKWPEMLDWLKSNDNPLIAESTRKGRIEHLFTVLDLSQRLSVENLADCWRARGDGLLVAEAEGARKGFIAATRRYEECRSMLLYALEQYFNYRHYLDASEAKSPSGTRWSVSANYSPKMIL